MVKLKNTILLAVLVALLLTGCGNENKNTATVFADVNTATELESILAEEDPGEAVPETIDDLILTCNIDGVDFWGVKSIVEGGGGQYRVHKLDNNAWATSYGTADVIGEISCDVLDVLYEAANGSLISDIWGSAEDVANTFISVPLKEALAEAGDGTLYDLMSEGSLYYQTLSYDSVTGPQCILLAVTFHDDLSFSVLQAKFNTDHNWTDQLIEKLISTTN